MRKTLDYICMQPTREGQASYAHVNEIVAGLRRRGWDVRLVEPPHPRPGRADGVRRAVAAASTQLAYLVRGGFRPGRFVYIRSHFLTLPMALLLKASGTIVVQEVNGPDDDVYDAWPQLRALHGLLSLDYRAQVRLASAVVVVTPGLADYLRAYTGRPGPYHVIGNGADVEMFRPAGTSRPLVTPGSRYVVFVGALASWQGIDTVLEAMDSPAWPAGIDLVIAGDGKERDHVAAAARDDARIQWRGTIPYSDTPILIAGSLAALVPKADAAASRFGLSPLKLYEAMACGVPVVASDLAGLADTIREHGCGLTFAAGDAGGLARAVAALAADPGAAADMGARGREAAVRHYSWDARAGQTEEVLLQLAGRGPARDRPSRRKV